MPEKQAAKSLCQMHTAGKITQKKPQLLRCTAHHNTFFCIAEKWIFIFSFPAVCTTATKVQVLPLSITSILVPLQELTKQHVAYLLLHILPTAILFQVKILPDTDSVPQEKASFGHSSIQPVIPSRPPIKSRAILARLHSAYPICPRMTRCYDLYHCNVLLGTFKSLL